MTQEPAQKDNGSTLTFGLEVELFSALKNNRFNRFTHFSLASLLGTRLRRTPLNGPEGGGAEIRVEDEDYDADCEDGLDYSCWNLTTDDVAVPNHPEWFEGYESQSLEVISPPYRMSSIFWERDLQRVFTLQTFRYNPIPWRELQMYCEQNSSTSVHIHIGNGTDADAAFPFHTVRSLAMILLVYEIEIDKLFESATTMQSRPEKVVRCISSASSPFFKHLPARSTRPDLALHLLNNCTDIEAIIDAMNPDGFTFTTPSEVAFFKYNFTPLLDSVHPTPVTNIGGNCKRIPKRKPPTVEFRYLPGTLDPDTMTHWIRFLGSLVEFAGKIGPQALVEFLGLDQCGKSASDSLFSLSAFSMLSGLQPVGGFARLLTAMESAHIPLDPDTTRFWRRKIEKSPC
ncbi:hypothetical protein LOZ53_001592 [Ophidiomyces ophidiicola]|nr:hypothetical protein LOZ61_004268 [Ophidiomyces ophidiicola]KAI1929061.1 hypothetical protein LOZ60_001976 [Ophidiomyces ophidiicola]KAI1981023.1 hypothetical protein LOZ55_000909 [Ophidiomyces ophidiicola]KAI1990511.1 hypothetical protein LOZ51_004862 [Ophidiomyces ophidiicola]KAI1994327.1 hypothetical protein LOZ54_000997 [Ophidiomyces ophidiicola]